MKKYGIRLCIMFMLVLTACGKKQKAADETVYRIYEVNKEETKVASREITTTETDTEKLLGVLIEELEKTPEDTENRAAITETIQLQSSTVADESANLNSKYRFDTFVVGGNNKFAHSASLAVAESPGVAYNPLYLYILLLLFRL